MPKILSLQVGLLYSAFLHLQIWVCVHLKLTCGFIRGSSSDLSHHESGHLGGELQQVGEFLHHAAGRCVPKHLKWTKKAFDYWKNNNLKKQEERNQNKTQKLDICSL